MTSFVTDEFGVRLAGDPDVARLVRLGLRRNPRRAHLLVSTVLGKHIPADPRLVRDTGLELGRRVGKALDGRSAVVLGFAETATGLGHCVAEALGADYLQSTRRLVPGVPVASGFEEEHSHATSHRLLPEDPALLGSAEALVLVDDELSTGRTVVNTLAALHTARPVRRCVVAVLVDLRGERDAAEMAESAARLGTELDVVALARGTVAWPADFPARAVAAAAAAAEGDLPPGPATPADDEPGTTPAVRHIAEYRGLWPSSARESGRHGFGPADVRAARRAATGVAVALAPRCGRRVLVLGTEELMYAPTLIAERLADRLPYVRVSSTTRSPVVVLDRPGYPVRNGLAFPSHDRAADGPGTRYAYNVAGAWTDVVVVVDADADGPQLRDGLLARLATMGPRVHLVVLPCHRPVPAPLRGPHFGSYPADEVGWLLTDLSGVALEAAVEEREEAIQSGGAHYAESLPVEYRPDVRYRELFDQALEAAAERVAYAVGLVTEIVLAERGPEPVLASLARAGTPAGALIRRWARFAHGRDLPHYTLSIVRGRGIDTLALRYLAGQHDPEQVVFVDGWTGKGAIARELAAAVTAANRQLCTAFRAELAVLADPGRCVRTFGTRADFLVPSACLNSTVSGLVSRTVLNPAVLGPGQYHGAKFYRHLEPDDVSVRFLDAISDRFPDVAAAVARDWPRAAAADRTATWAGWAEVRALGERYGIEDVTLVKPGVGETTRVLLRRVPWAVLARPGAGRDLDHVRLLAERRGVPVWEVPGLTFSCVGIVHPRYSRAATGADGRAARR